MAALRDDELLSSEERMDSWPRGEAPPEMEDTSGRIVEIEKPVLLRDLRAIGGEPGVLGDRYDLSVFIPQDRLDEEWTAFFLEFREEGTGSLGSVDGNILHCQDIPFIHPLGHGHHRDSGDGISMHQGGLDR